MKTARTISSLRGLLEEPRRGGKTIGLVPTMGYLHAGHASLVQLARSQVDVVIVSLFVNPKQFNESSDLDQYPRDEPGDIRLLTSEGADLLFAPEPDEMYPADFSTAVVVGGVSESMEGEKRGVLHFSGVATVVAKLFNIVQPSVAYFGQKDFQQTVVIQRLVRDLAFPVRIEVCPTVREPDGLAMSSRNVRLLPAERSRAVALKRGLDAAAASIASGVRDAATVVAAAKAVMADYDVEPEYLEVVVPETLAPVRRITHPVVIAVAARLGDVRLIDNVRVEVAAP